MDGRSGLHKHTGRGSDGELHQHNKPAIILQGKGKASVAGIDRFSLNILNIFQYLLLVARIFDFEGGVIN